MIIHNKYLMKQNLLYKNLNKVKCKMENYYNTIKGIKHIWLQRNSQLILKNNY